MSEHGEMKVDKPLLILGLLLAVVLVAFMTGRIPWPYGILVLVLLMIARVSYLKSGKAGRRH